MKKLVLLISLVWAAAAHAAVFEYSVTLSGPAESPPVGSPGSGSGSVTYNDFLHTLTLELTFGGLIGNTTASHIHGPTPDPFLGTAGVATTTPSFAGFPSGVTSGSYSNTLDLTLPSSFNANFINANGGTPASAEAALAAAMASGRAYWNVHSTFATSGEIRGFLVAVPEPSTFSLLGLCGVGLALRARRKHQRQA